jgi:hypothetical protein
LALHVLKRTKEEKLCEKAASLLERSQRLMPEDQIKK